MIKSGGSQSVIILFDLIKMQTERSHLHQQTFMRWFDKRCRTTVSGKYICLPDQRNYISRLEKLFEEFDKDGSKSLSVTELCDLFKRFGFAIHKEQMEYFFKLVDDNSDGSLTMEEFKRCLLDTRANQYFGEMIRTVKCEGLVRPLPSFKKVLNQINYLEQREAQVKIIDDNNLHVGIRSQVIPNLLRLSEKIEIQTSLKNFSNYTSPRQNKYKKSFNEQFNSMVKRAQLDGLNSRFLQYEAARTMIKRINPSVIDDAKTPSTSPQFMMKFFNIDRSPTKIRSQTRSPVYTVQSNTTISPHTTMVSKSPRFFNQKYKFGFTKPEKMFRQSRAQTEIT